MNDSDHIGFGDDGQPVPIALFDYGDTELPVDALRAERLQTISRLIQFLREGTTTPAQIGRQVALLAYWTGSLKSQREVAEFLGVSPAAICKQVKKQRAKFRGLLSD